MQRSIPVDKHMPSPHYPSYCDAVLLNILIF
jgi:hypothetical protein